MTSIIEETPKPRKEIPIDAQIIEINDEDEDEALQ